MAYPLPTKTDLNGTPTEGTFKTAFGVLYDYMAARLGGGSVSASAAEQLTARNSLGVPVVNYLLNPDGEVAQYLPASSSDGDYDFDQWYALTQTGSVASTQISNPEDGYRYGMRMTQSQASAQRMARAQIIEGREAVKLRGKAVTFGGRRRLSTSANIRMAILEWTGTEDAPTKDQVNDWTSGTYTGGNFFKSTTLTVTAVSQVAMTANTARDCSVSGTIGSSVTNILVLEWTEATAAQNVTFDAWGSRLIEASSLIDAIRRTYDQELALCERHAVAFYSDAFAGFVSTTTTASIAVTLPRTMRGGGPSTLTNLGNGTITTGAATAATSNLTLSNSAPRSARVEATTSGMTVGQSAILIGQSFLLQARIGA